MYSNLRITEESEVQMQTKCKLEECQNTFHRYPSYVKRGVKEFCSQSCAGKFHARERKRQGLPRSGGRKKSIRTKHQVRIEAMGLTLEQLSQLREENGETCQICGKKCGAGLQLAVDHDHQTGLFRGFLCFSCNTKLGWFENNREAILEYLDR